MSNYTPSEEEVRDWVRWIDDYAGHGGDSVARFDRFLAEDRRKTAARALREAAGSLPNTSWAPVGTWLLDRANRIEKGDDA